MCFISSTIVQHPQGKLLSPPIHLSLISTRLVFLYLVYLFSTVICLLPDDNLLSGCNDSILYQRKFRIVGIIQVTLFHFHFLLLPMCTLLVRWSLSISPNIISHKTTSTLWYVYYSFQNPVHTIYSTWSLRILKTLWCPLLWKSPYLQPGVRIRTRFHLTHNSHYSLYGM